MTGKRDSIKERLNGIFREVFDDDTIEISDTMTAKDIAEWDSLNHIVLVVAVEKEFGLKLNAAEVGKLENVGSMLTLLEGRATK
ncbi:MAG: acyl carrier protein [Candidatus Omnitrophota bacterium]|nr:acyl carrier protein [Candidatus Omnitrophota bacterium]